MPVLDRASSARDEREAVAIVLGQLSAQSSSFSASPEEAGSSAAPRRRPRLEGDQS